MKSTVNKDITVNKLIKMSGDEFFKIGTSERAKRVGKFTYLGFKYVLHRNDKKKLVVYIKLYFIAQGAKNNGKRERYTLVAMLPFKRKIKNMKRLYDLPVKLFSSDPSFKWYFAYALNKYNLVINDEKVILRHLGESLTTAPKKRNPDLVKQLTKHFYKFFVFISNKKPREYLNDKFELSPDFTTPILNKGGLK